MTSARESSALLSLHDVSLAFSGVQALRNVNLDVTEGSLQAVIGPNGAGKTSLFNCISGVYQPQQGSLRFAGHDLRSLRPHRVAASGVARMFQNLALFDQLTVLENLLLGCHHLYNSRWWDDLLWRHRARSQEISHRHRAEEIIDFLDLESYRRKPVGALPYGVLKRVELGRALCMQPRLLLLDEPAAGLNQEETEDMARYLLDIKEELGVTQIIIEHDLGLVMDLADTVLVLDFGREIASGSPTTVQNHPAVIEAYLGRPAEQEPS